MIREVKNLQLPVVVPKEILESSDLIVQVNFPVVNVLWYNFLTFRQVILEMNFLSLFITVLTLWANYVQLYELKSLFFFFFETYDC